MSATTPHPPVYPPERHLLRDLRLEVEPGADLTARVRMPIVPELLAPDGGVRTGVLAVLVDVLGGGLAGRAAAPDWIATADLTLHLTALARHGPVEAHGRVLRAGRSTVVLEVALTDAGGSVGLATMTFSVLARRSGNPVIETGAGPVLAMARPDSGYDRPVLDALGVRTAPDGTTELPITDEVRNSLGGLQGGLVALTAEVACAAAVTGAGGGPVRTTDLQLAYLAFGRTGPARAVPSVLALGPGFGTVHVEVNDAGAERRMAVARAVAGPAPA